MSFSLTGKPPQDLCLTNLAVKDTLVATQTTALNINANTINGLPTGTILQPIRSVFTGAEIGQYVVQNNMDMYILAGIINQSGVEQKANTVLAQIDNYRQPAVTFPGFLFSPEAPTIDSAGVSMTVSVDENGQVYLDVDVGAAAISTPQNIWRKVHYVLD